MPCTALHNSVLWSNRLQCYKLRLL